MTALLREELEAITRRDNSIATAIEVREWAYRKLAALSSPDAPNTPQGAAVVGLLERLDFLSPCDDMASHGADMEANVGETCTEAASVIRSLTAERDEWKAEAEAHAFSLDQENKAAAQIEAERDALREALEPSGDTKAAYHGEFKFQVTQWREDDEGEQEEYLADFVVPWTTVKEIMAAIKARSALSSLKGAPS